MANQNQYTPEVVELKGGLDFVTPRPSVAPGMLLDCLNFEVGTRQGYELSEGYTAFDGRPSPANVFNNVYYMLYGALGIDTLRAGSVVTRSTDTISSYFGTIISTGTDTNGTYALITINDLTIVYESSENGGFSFLDSFNNEYNVSAGGLISAWQGLLRNGIIANAQDYLNLLQPWYNDLRATISNAGTWDYTIATVANPVTGLTWWNDQLYGISDCYTVYFSGGSTPILPGDYLTGTPWPGSSYALLVRDIQVISGSFGAANATGYIMFSVVNSNGTFPYNTFSILTGLTPPGFGQNMTIKRGNVTFSNALQVSQGASSAAQAWGANLYRTYNISQLPAGSQTEANQGWQEIDLGWQITFGSGTSNGPPKLPGRDGSPATATILPSPNPANSPTSTNSYEGCATIVNVPAGSTIVNATTASGNQLAYTGTSGHPEQSLRTINNASFYTSLLGHTAVGSTTIPALLSGFSYPEIPSDAVITGFVVNVGVWKATGFTANYAVTVGLGFSNQTGASSTKTTPNVTSTTATAVNQFTLGSNVDTWGIPSASLTVANLPNLVAEFLLTTTSTGSNGNVHVDYFNVTVYYETSSSVYYFNNGTDDVQAIITNTYLQSGSWLAGTAAGIMQVAQVKAAGSAARQQISSNDKIYTLPGGSGTSGQLQIGTVTSDMAYAGLASYSQLQAAGSQYQIIDANFYANKNWDALYGCSGAGRAFVYDGFYFRKIFTGLSDPLDTPRFCAFHNFHLCLGYQAGALFTSAPGLPEDFSGLDGAAEFDTGDEITGLIRLTGTVLGILCKKSAQGLNGTGNENFSMSVISPYEGAIPYTTIDSVKPIYTTYRGISTMDSTDQYGNFLGRRLSNNITPWIIPRVTNQPGNIPYGNVSNVVGAPYSPDLSKFSAGPRFAMPIRNKNQYKLVFEDGIMLTMALFGDDQIPQFTHQQYQANSGGGNTILYPYAYSSGVDSSGADRNHISNFNTILGKGVNAFPVYELNKGWVWDLAGYPSGYIITTQNFYDNPFSKFLLRKIRLHGVSHGASDITVTASSDYQWNEFSPDTHGETPLNSVPQDISLQLDNPTNLYPNQISNELQPYTALANVPENGRCFAFQFNASGYPVVLQHLMLQGSLAKADI